MTYREEFPDFDPATMPALPAGYVDVSWSADVCPSFNHATDGFTIYVDYADRNMQEFPGAPRFSVHRANADGSDDTIIVATDEWSAVLDAIR